MARPPTITADDLDELARIYNTAVDIGQGHRAVQIVAQWFGVSLPTVHRHLETARDAGLIVVFDEDGHRPHRVRPTRGGTSWVACALCRQPWPCTDFTTTSRKAS